MSTVEVAQALALAADEVGASVLTLQEDQWFDRKSARVTAASLADSLVAFANAEGGVVVVGLHDGAVEGTDRDERHRNALMQAAMDFTEPPVRARSRLVGCRRDDGSPDHLLVVEVEPGDSVHANRKDEVFLRVGNEKRRLSFVQRQELTFDKGQASYEATPLRGSDPGELRLDLIQDYAAVMRHPSAERLLQARGLLSPAGDVTVGGLLLFGEQPQARLPAALVQVLRYRGVERGAGSRQQLVEDLRCDGPIPQVLAAAQEAIGRLQPTRRALGVDGRFGQVGIVPRDAWLEGLVNAVVHRSYSIAGDHIRIEIFDDRIEVESPGRFPGLVSLRDPLTTIRFARNPRIARVCADLEFGQELGEGIRRIYEEMRLAGLADPVYRQTPASVRLALSGRPADRELEERLPPGTRQALSALRVAGRLGTGDLVDVLGVSRPVALRRLQVMRDEGLIEWVGKSPKDPRAYWRLPVGP